MNALLEFLVRVIGDVGRLGDIFVNDVLAAGDPIAAIIFLVGQVMMLAAVAAFGYVVLGEILKMIGIPLPKIGKGRGSSTRTDH